MIYTYIQRNIFNSFNMKILNCPIALFPTLLNIHIYFKTRLNISLSDFRFTLSVNQLHYSVKIFN